jgi:hypothetical protein
MSGCWRSTWSAHAGRYPVPCHDCAVVTEGKYRAFRSGSNDDIAPTLTPGGGTATGGTSSGGTGGSSIGTVDNEQALGQLMHEIAVPLANVLSTIMDETKAGGSSGAETVQAQCPGGGSADFGSVLGDLTFTECQLGGVALSGSCIASLATGTATMAEGRYALSGNATGDVHITLATLTWTSPRTTAGTQWKVSLDVGTSTPICAQDSGDPCS